MSKSRQTVIAIALLCLLAACGNVTGVDDDGSDAGGDDTTAPGIVSSTPADGAILVSLLTSSIEIVFDEPLDPATVSDATVSLTSYSGEWRHPVDVGYDEGARAVTIQTRRPLRNGYNVIHIDGIADPAGNPLSTTLAFNTHWNTSLQYTGYSAGQINERCIAELDQQGTWDERTCYSGPGNDLDWGTADDVVGGLTDYTFGFPTGRWEAVTSYSSDDSIQYFDRYTYEGTRYTEIRSYEGPGTDGLPDTVDDVMNRRIVYEYGDDALYDRTISFDEPGPDAQWATADDEIAYYATYVRDDQGRTLSATSYVDAGTDQTWFTADDTISYRTEFSHAPDSIRQVHRNAPGLDGLWGTDDDTQFYIDTTTAADDGRSLAQARVNAPGADGVWQTADDPIAARLVYEYDPNEVYVGSVEYDGAGIDGSWGTSDDRVAEYWTIEIDDNGNRVIALGFAGAGADGLWFTADDQRQSENTFETDL